MKKIQEKEDDLTNVIPLDEARLKFAAKEPPKGGNWLGTLAKGTRFLAIEKNNYKPICGDFFVGSDPGKMPAVFLGFEIHTKQGGFRFVEPNRFSSMYEFIQTLEVEIPDDGPEVQGGGVESDGDAEVLDSLHESE